MELIESLEETIKSGDPQSRHEANTVKGDLIFPLVQGKNKEMTIHDFDQIYFMKLFLKASEKIESFTYQEIADKVLAVYNTSTEILRFISIFGLNIDLARIFVDKQQHKWNSLPDAKAYYSNIYEDFRKSLLKNDIRLKTRRLYPMLTDETIIDDIERFNWTDLYSAIEHYDKRYKKANQQDIQIANDFIKDNSLIPLEELSSSISSLGGQDRVGGSSNKHTISRNSAKLGKIACPSSFGTSIRVPLAHTSKKSSTQLGFISDPLEILANIQHLEKSIHLPLRGIIKKH